MCNFQAVSLTIARSVEASDDDVPKAASSAPIPKKPVKSKWEGEDEEDDLRTRVEKSGAIPITDTDIMLLNDVSVVGPISKERVPFVQAGEMEKLVVNVLMVVYVP